MLIKKRFTDLSCMYLFYGVEQLSASRIGEYARIRSALWAFQSS